MQLWLIFLVYCLTFGEVKIVVNCSDEQKREESIADWWWLFVLIAIILLLLLIICCCCCCLMRRHGDTYKGCVIDVHPACLCCIIVHRDLSPLVCKFGCHKQGCYTVLTHLHQ